MNLYTIFLVNNHNRFEDDHWYDDRGYSTAPEVQVNVAMTFLCSVASLLSLILIFQMYYLDGWTFKQHRGRNVTSRHTTFILAAYLILTTAYLIVVACKQKLWKFPTSFNQWLFSLLYSSCFGLGFKYVPQVYKNRRFRIFEGVSRSRIILDVISAISLLLYAIIDTSSNYSSSFHSTLDHSPIINRIAVRLLACLYAAMTLVLCSVLLAQSTKYGLLDTELDRFVHSLLENAETDFNPETLFGRAVAAAQYNSSRASFNSESRERLLD
jgi:hypothetical protein